MELPPHHYTHVLRSLLQNKPDLTLQVKDGQVVCHKPVLACHSSLLKDVLLHTDADIIVLPDFRKNEVTNLVLVLYGQVQESFVSRQLLEALGINVPTRGSHISTLAASRQTQVNCPEKNGHKINSKPGEIPQNINSRKSIFDIDPLEEENEIIRESYSFSPSLADLYKHMQTCDKSRDCQEVDTQNCHEVDTQDCQEVDTQPQDCQEVDTQPQNCQEVDTQSQDCQEIIYQCSLCDLVCSNLEDLHNHMNVHCNEDVIMGDIEEAVLNADFVIEEEQLENKQETDLESEHNIHEITAKSNNQKDIIIEEIDDNDDFLVIDEEVEVQDPSIETTEVTVGSEVIAESKDDPCLKTTHCTLGSQIIANSKNQGDIETAIHFEDASESKPPPYMEMNAKNCFISPDQEKYLTKLNVNTTIDYKLKTKTIKESTCWFDKNLSGVEEEQSTILYSCKLCLKSFSTESFLSLHTQSAHQNHRAKSDTSSELNQFQNGFQFFCPFCQRELDSLSSLNEHTVDCHTELFEIDKMVEEQEDILTQAIEITDLIEGNEQVANQEVSLFYSCTLCENSFDSPRALTQHVATNHVTKPLNTLPVSCKYCDVSFIGRTTLAKHYKALHPGQEQIYQCPECGKSLKTATSLERHEKRHTGLKPFQCGQCQAKFCLAETLGVHAKRGCKQNKNINLQKHNTAPVLSSSHPVLSSLHPVLSSSHPVLSSSHTVVSICVNANTNSIKMSCTECSLDFDSHQDYLSHSCKPRQIALEQSLVQLEQSLTCAACKKIFKSTNNLQVHISNGCKTFLNTQFQENWSKIEDTSEEFIGWSKIVDTSEEFIGKKPMEINAEEKENRIEKASKDNNRTLSNVQLVIEDPRETYKYKCEACSYNTNIRHSYTNHIHSLKHKENSNIKKYNCEQCDMRFGTLIFLDKHINQKHKEKKGKQKILQDIDVASDVDENVPSLHANASIVETIEELKETNRELLSKSGRKIIPRKFADGEVVSILGVNRSKRRKVESNHCSDVDSEEEGVHNGLLGTNCEMCGKMLVSTVALFVHMLSHVPPGIRANLPEGNHGWCPHCPGPVPVKQINSHVADSHPEILETSEDPDIDTGEIPCDGDLREIPCDGDLGEIPSDADLREIPCDGELDMMECSPAFVKMVPVDLTKYGVDAKDYM